MKIEMHAHTSEVSPCARIDAEGMIKAYSQIDYSAVMVTDHFNDFIIESYPGSKRDKVDQYLTGYRSAKQTGDRLGVKVLLGVETCLAGGMEDYLLYGIDEAFLFEHPTMYRYTQKQLFEAAEAAGALVYQAHPFRSYCHPADPRYLHGVEVYNGNTRSFSNNKQALAWASLHPHLGHSSGSDYHDILDLGKGGIILPDDAKIESSLDLVGYMKYNNITIIS